MNKFDKGNWDDTSLRCDWMATWLQETYFQPMRKHFRRVKLYCLQVLWPSMFIPTAINNSKEISSFLARNMRLKIGFHC